MVAHRKLLHQLSMYGIRGPLLQWFTPFLIGRKQKVILNGAASSWRDVISGVPQGTILGPVMFLFYVNDIPNHAKSTTKLFADACKLYRDIRTRDDCALLQDDLDSLAAWSRDWLLRFSKEKWVALCIQSLHTLHRRSLPQERWAPEGSWHHHITRSKDERPYTNSHQEGISETWND